MQLTQQILVFMVFNLFGASRGAYNSANSADIENLIKAPLRGLDTTNNSGIGFGFLGTFYTPTTLTVKNDSANKGVFEMGLIGSIIKIRQVFITFVLLTLTAMFDFNFDFNLLIIMDYFTLLILQRYNYGLLFYSEIILSIILQSRLTILLFYISILE